MNRSFLIQKKFGCICVSDTKVASDNCIKQEIYLIPMRKDNGNTVNDDFEDIMVAKNHYILSLGRKSINDYIKVLGSDINIEFSKLKKASDLDKKKLYNLLISNKDKISDKQHNFKNNIELLYKLSMNGDIHRFNMTVDTLKKDGFQFNNDALEELKIRCFSEHTN